MKSIRRWFSNFSRDGSRSTCQYHLSPNSRIILLLVLWLETLFLFNLPFMSIFWYIFFGLKVCTLTNSERFHKYIFEPFLLYYRIFDPVRTIMRKIISLFVKVGGDWLQAVRVDGRLHGLDLLAHGLPAIGADASDLSHKHEQNQRSQIELQQRKKRLSPAQAELIDSGPDEVVFSWGWLRANYGGH